MSEQPIDDGGPAFPQTNEQRYNDPAHGIIRPSDIYGPAPSGMSLRDYFAGHASENDITHWQHIMAMNGTSVEREQAKYIYADRMLAARTGKGAGNG